MQSAALAMIDYVCLSVRLSVGPSVTVWYHLKIYNSSYGHAVFTGGSMNLVSSWYFTKGT